MRAKKRQRSLNSRLNNVAWTLRPSETLSEVDGRGVHPTVHHAELVAVMMAMADDAEAARSRQTLPRAELLPGKSRWHVAQVSGFRRWLAFRLFHGFDESPKMPTEL